MKICLWQHQPSLHQLALVEGLKKRSDLIWVIEKDMLDKNRASMGWESSSNCKPNYCLSNNEKGFYDPR